MGASDLLRPGRRRVSKLFFARPVAIRVENAEVEDDYSDLLRPGRRGVSKLFFARPVAIRVENAEVEDGGLGLTPPR